MNISVEENDLPNALIISNLLPKTTFDIINSNNREFIKRKLTKKIRHCKTNQIHSSLHLISKLDFVHNNQMEIFRLNGSDFLNFFKSILFKISLTFYKKLFNNFADL